MKILFMGTPDIAVSMLKQILADGYDVIGVVTQPDKKAGRKQELKMSEVKQCALQHNIPVYQPVRIKDDYKDLMMLGADLIVTCAYGQFIPSELLEAPTYGSINDLTGSIASVKAADIVKSPASNAMEALQGQVPG